MPVSGSELDTSPKMSTMHSGREEITGQLYEPYLSVSAIKTECRNRVWAPSRRK